VPRFSTGVYMYRLVSQFAVCNDDSLKEWAGRGLAVQLGKLRTSATYLNGTMVPDHTSSLILMNRQLIQQYVPGDNASRVLDPHLLRDVYCAEGASDEFRLACDARLADSGNSGVLDSLRWDATLGQLYLEAVYNHNMTFPSGVLGEYPAERLSGGTPPRTCGLNRYVALIWVPGDTLVAGYNVLYGMTDAGTNISIVSRNAAIRMARETTTTAFVDMDDVPAGFDTRGDSLQWFFRSLLACHEVFHQVQENYLQTNASDLWANRDADSLTFALHLGHHLQWRYLSQWYVHDGQALYSNVQSLDCSNGTAVASFSVQPAAPWEHTPGGRWKAYKVCGRCWERTARHYYRNDTW
jgi:hypothetical protein